ncbi:MAG: hypothetical protein OEU44_04985 [Gammaproteobacteria bacterium]|nr:hypothetical protein [Gammaproteobacteria bacterium]
MDKDGQRTSMRRILSVLAVAVATGTGGLNVSPEYGPGWWSVVQAAEAGHSGGHSGSHGGGGHDTGHIDHDSDHGDDHDSGHAPGSRGRGGLGTHRGGHGQDVARGGGKAVEDRILRGRRPVWAQEGIPEVELGRLNVARAPGHVLARAEAEALATYQAGMVALYNLDADQAAGLLASSYREVARYDSPLQNLALYKDLMTFGATQLQDVQPASRLDLAAIFLGSASDKTIPVSEDSVIALNRILGLLELSPEERATLATKAETVREAILAGHGPDIGH